MTAGAIAVTSTAVGLADHDDEQALFVSSIARGIYNKHVVGFERLSNVRHLRFMP